MYLWSKANQIESDLYRTLPDDLSKLGKFICHCWFDVAGGSNDEAKERGEGGGNYSTLGNGVGRLILEFSGGFTTRGNHHALIGLPKEGKQAETAVCCSNCIQVINGTANPLRCCGCVRYCGDKCQKKDWKKHKTNCLRMKKKK